MCIPFVDLKKIIHSLNVNILSYLDITTEEEDEQIISKTKSYTVIKKFHNES